MPEFKREKKTITTATELKQAVTGRVIFVQCGMVRFKVKRTSFLSEFQFAKYHYHVMVETVDGEYVKAIYIEHINQYLK